MSNNAAPAVDAEMQQFQDDLLQSVREFKAGNFACVTRIEPCVVDMLNVEVNLAGYRTNKLL